MGKAIQAFSQLGIKAFSGGAQELLQIEEKIDKYAYKNQLPIIKLNIKYFVTIQFLAHTKHFKNG